MRFYVIMLNRRLFNGFVYRHCKMVPEYSSPGPSTQAVVFTDQGFACEEAERLNKIQDGHVVQPMKLEI